MGAGKDHNRDIKPSSHLIDLETEALKAREFLPEVIEIRFQDGSFQKSCLGKTNAA